MPISAERFASLIADVCLLRVQIVAFARRALQVRGNSFWAQIVSG
jgi:hypothetical protein